MFAKLVFIGSDFTVPVIYRAVVEVVAVFEAVEVEEAVMEVMRIGKIRGIWISQEADRKENRIRN